MNMTVKTFPTTIFLLEGGFFDCEMIFKEREKFWKEQEWVTVKDFMLGWSKFGFAVD